MRPDSFRQKPSGQATTSQWFQWADYTADGRLAVSYYDRQYGNAELTGWSDFTLSGSKFRETEVLL